WSLDTGFRESLLIPEIAREVNLDGYVKERFQETLWDTPLISGESDSEIRRRQMSFMNIRWFMGTLLDRKDRCSMASGLEVRVPYADHRLIDYVYNVPWDYKCRNGVQKSLLRDAAVGLLPEDILYRKKSPYPKTHNPGYEALLKSKLRYILMDSMQPIHKLLSPETAKGLLTEKFDYGKPWFGQLMAGPQLLAYLIQINYWMLRYNIYVDL
ncbi:MAG: asparagine synthase C-terminal domain-containing protein, partial [Oscillospiraceae bacterium]